MSRFIMLHKYDKNGRGTYEWIVNAKYIITISTTRFGTMILLDDGGVTENTLVSESIDDIARLLNAQITAEVDE